MFWWLRNLKWFIFYYFKHLDILNIIITTHKITFAYECLYFKKYFRKNAAYWCVLNSVYLIICNSIIMTVNMSLIIPQSKIYAFLEACPYTLFIYSGFILECLTRTIYFKSTFTKNCFFIILMYVLSSLTLSVSFTCLLLLPMCNPHYPFPRGTRSRQDHSCHHQLHRC